MRAETLVCLAAQARELTLSICVHRSRFLAALGCDINDIDCLYYKDWEQIIEAQDAARQFIPIDEPISAFMQILPTGTTPPHGPNTTPYAG